MKKLIFLFLTIVAIKANAQVPVKGSGNLPPALSSIREQDIHRDLFKMANDAMRGRRAGTIDELRAAAWVAQQAQKAGLKPAGDDGTYFQFFPLVRTIVSVKSKILLNAKELSLWKDAWVTNPIEADVEGPVLWLSSLADTIKTGIKGSILAINITPPTPLPAHDVSLWAFRYVFSALYQQGRIFKAHGAIAVILVADSITQSALQLMSHELDFENGSYQLEDDQEDKYDLKIPVILVDKNLSEDLQQSSAHVKVNLRSERFIFPSVNVVAEATGKDNNLRKEYVLFSGHIDHDGVGAPVDGDSIWNGADDNASVSVALLAIGRAFISKPAKRSALFVWHGAEERGLFGSRWYATHPTVKKEAITAVINGDMIGRNAQDSAALLAVTKPHRNSMDLVNAAIDANEQVGHFKIDSTWDRQDHPEYWYYRSDHLSYAQAGIPDIFFSTLLHPDYHTPKDEPDRIDYTKLTQMSRWMYATGWLVANALRRPTLDKNVIID